MGLRVVEVSRPGPPGYFRPANEGAGLLDWDTTARRFAAQRNYWISTASKAACPHAMPVWGVWLDDRLLFSTSPESRKARNLFENPRVAVHIEDGNASIVVEGRAYEVRDSVELSVFLAAYNPKYAWDFTFDQVSRGVFAVRPEKAFAWLGSDTDTFGGTGTRWRFATTH